MLSTLLGIYTLISTVAIMYHSAECGVTNIEIEPYFSPYELSPPVSGLYAPLYRESSNCQWLFTTPPGHVLYAQFIEFDIEKETYQPFADVLLGDHLFIGTDTTSQRSKLVRYTGSDSPLNIETPSNSLVITFVTDASVARNGFTVWISSRARQILPGKGYRSFSPEDYFIHSSNSVQ